MIKWSPISREVIFGWFTDLTKRERQAMGACFFGWALDAMDVQVFSFVIPTLISTWGVSKGQAGSLGTITLLISALGGWFAGGLSDRFGRVRMLQITVLWYAFFTFLCGFTQNFEQLFICRALQGFGFGGEWATGSVLIGEIIRDKYRGRVVGFVQSGWAVGWGAAALLFTALFSVLPESVAWRCLFWIGLAPALIVFWIQGHVAEPEIFRKKITGTPMRWQFMAMFRSEHIATTLKVSLLCFGATGGSYTFLIWLPTFLETVRHLSVVGTGGFTFVLIIGSFFGFVCGAYMSDWIGRKTTFMISAIGAGIMLVVYMLLPLSNYAMLFMGFPLGFFSFMMYSPMGPFMTELFPTEIRGTAQGFCYNAGRAFGAFFPGVIGILSQKIRLGTAIALFGAAAYSLMLISLVMLPETLGWALDTQSSLVTYRSRPKYEMGSELSEDPVSRSKH
jgi:MFS family permease